MAVLRGSQANARSQTRTRSTPRGKPVRSARQRAWKSPGQPRHGELANPVHVRTLQARPLADAERRDGQEERRAAVGIVVAAARQVLERGTVVGAARDDELGRTHRLDERRAGVEAQPRGAPARAAPGGGEPHRRVVVAQGQQQPGRDAVLAQQARFDSLEQCHGRPGTLAGAARLGAERIERGREPRVAPVGAERVPEADRAAGQPHGRARHGDLAEVERRSVAADPTARHDETDLGTAQRHHVRRRAEPGPRGLELVAAREGEQAQCPPPVAYGGCIGARIIGRGHALSRSCRHARRRSAQAPRMLAGARDASVTVSGSGRLPVRPATSAAVDARTRLRGAFPGPFASALPPGNRRERSPGTQAHRVLTRAPTNGGRARRSRRRHSDSRLSTDLSSPPLRELPNRSDSPEARRKCSHSRAAALPPTGQAWCTTLPDPSRFQRAGPAHVVLRQPGRPARDDYEALSQRGISRVKKAAGCRRRTVDRRFPRQ